MPYAPSYSETFLRAHVERLPAAVTLIHGWMPAVGARPLLSRPRRIAHEAWKIVSRTSADAVTAAYLRAFRRYRPRAILAEYGPGGVHVAEACRRAGIPLVVHFHGFDVSQRDVLKANAATYPKLFETAAAIVAVSRVMHVRLLGLGAPDEKIHYNPCGVDCREFGGASPQGAGPVFLAVGRFVPKKAPQVTLEAFAWMRRHVPEATLRMVGDGPLLDECKRLARDLGIGDAVTFLGAQPHQVVRDEMRRARCFVQHSVEAESGDCEGTPVAIMEAGASSLPVVSTRHGGITDVVVEGETGLLVDEHDVNGMAKHMLSLAQDSELAARLGAAARARIEREFSMEWSIGRLWHIIETAAR
jgi:glycosyltransferase involved in cell wall biosynthesis